ncbi:MAG: hypothetical protein R6T92_07695, partial [Desulfosalsimonadaceae bacterium]
MMHSCMGCFFFASILFDGFVKRPISALRTISEESHVRLSTIDSSEIARALILNILQSRLKTTFYEFILFLQTEIRFAHKGGFPFGEI